MPTITDHLERATDELVAPIAAPTPDALRRVSARRRQRRRNAAVSATASIALLAAVGVATLRPTPGQHVEAIDTTESTQTIASSSPEPTSDGSTVAPEPDPAADLGEWAASRPWEEQTFLVPTAAELVRFLHDDAVWSTGYPVGGEVFVRGSADSAAVAQIFVLDGFGLEVTDGPEDWGLTFEDRVIDGPDGNPITVRIGTGDNTTIRALRPVDAGVLVVQGAAITEERAIELLLSAETQGTDVHLDEAPDGLAIDRSGRGGRQPGYTLVFEPADQSGYRLIRTDQPFARAVLDRSGESDLLPQRVTVRGVTGLVLAGESNDPQVFSVVWEEATGGVFILEAEYAPYATADELVRLAEALDSAAYADVVARLDDPTGFLEQRAETIAEWLEAAPLPSAWDPRPLVASPPMARLDTASLVANYTLCTWTTEFAAAVRLDDEERREVALANLTSWSDSPAAQTWIEEMSATSEDGFESTFRTGWEAQVAAFREVTDAADLDRLGVDDCGFVSPADR